MNMYIYMFKENTPLGNSTYNNDIYIEREREREKGHHRAGHIIV